MLEVLVLRPDQEELSREGHPLVVPWDAGYAGARGYGRRNEVWTSSLSFQPSCHGLTGLETVGLEELVLLG